MQHLLSPQGTGIHPADVASTEAFLEKCEQLDYPERIKFLINVGKQAGGHTEISGSSTHLIQNLAQGKLYDRRLALFTTFSSGDTDLALNSLSDPSRRIRGKACKLVARRAVDASILTAISKDGIPNDLLLLLIKALFKQRRNALVESILLVLKTTNSEVYEKCFLFGSKAFVARELPGRDFENTTFAQFLRLCRVHPDIACNWLIDLKSEIFQDSYIIKIFSHALPILYRAPLPDAIILRVLKNAIKLVSLKSIWAATQPFLNRIPEEIVQLVLDHGHDVSLSCKFPKVLAKVLNKFTVDKLFEIDEAQPFIRMGFQYLTPDLRVKTYERAWRSWTDVDGFIATTFLSHLPTQQRVAEARRQLVIPAISTRPKEKMAYASFLPYDEAFPIISEYTRSKDVDVRATAVPSLLATTVYDRAALTKALDLVMTRKNEADPVRSAMLQQIAALPRKAFRSEHLQALETVFEDAFSATDLSYNTKNYIQQTILARFNEFPIWAAERWTWYAAKSDYQLTARLSSRVDKQVALNQLGRLDTLVEPLIQDCMDRKNYSDLVSLANGLHGTFHKAMPPSMMKTLQQWPIGPGFRQAHQVLSFLRDQPSVRNQGGSRQNTYALQNEMMMRMLEEDKTWIRLAPVATFVQTRKQTLLHPYLVVFSDKGIHNPHGQSQVLPFRPNTFFRWTASQQDTYALTIRTLILESGWPPHSLIPYVRLLGFLHYTEAGYDTLLMLIKHENKVIRDAAVQRLSYLDESKGEKELIECLGDDRAPIAIRAFSRILKKLSKNDALAILLKVNAKQITVAKQLLRLIAGLGTEAALTALLEKEKSLNLHIDVRIVILQCLWHWVNRPEVLPVFLQNLKDPRTEVPIAIIEVPMIDDGTPRTKQLVEILAWALKHGPNDVTHAALQRCEQMTLNDNDARLAPLLAHWASSSTIPDDIQLASNALLKNYIKIAPEITNSIFEQSLHDKWRLQKHIQALARVALRADVHKRGLLMIIKTLESDRYCFSQMISVSFKVLNPAELLVKILDWIPLLHFEAFEIVKKATWQLWPPVSRGELKTFEKTLRNHSDERARRLGLEVLLQLAEGKDSWSRELRALLKWYQADESLMVSEAAVWVFPTGKLEEKGPEMEDLNDYSTEEEAGPKGKRMKK